LAEQQEEEDKIFKRIYIMLTNLEIKQDIRNIVLLISASLMLVSPLQAKSKYSFRKYQHVKKFYETITPLAIDISKKYHIPPAALLAIAGLESGYAQGYVAQITGNILSLGAFKSDPELPALYLPYSQSKKMVVFDPKEIQNLPQKDLEWKKRPKSLKKDYRPTPYAATDKELTLLKYNKKLRMEAYRACFEDFARKWISINSNIKNFKETRIWLDKLIAKNSYDILLEYETNEAFIYHIGGKPRSFNYRESWPKKVKLIMKKVGLVELVNNMVKNGMNFNEAWSKE
jgi:hypothetical protein